MNFRRLVWDLNQVLANRQAPVRRALSAVRHHRTFGGTAWVWLNQPADEAPVTGLLTMLPSVERVLTRGGVAARQSP